VRLTIVTFKVLLTSMVAVLSKKHFIAILNMSTLLLRVN
jgi:hypothetical protein